MIKIWQLIKRWLEANAPDIAESLLPGVSGSDVARAEKDLGTKFPRDLVSSLSICDGQRGAAAPLLGDWKLLPLKSIVQNWKTLHKVLSGETMAGLTPKARAAWWNDKWIPFASNGAGDYLCIDLSDKAGAKKGRVITFWHMREERKAVAGSFKELLATFANDLKANRYRYEDETMVKVKRGR